MPRPGLKPLICARLSARLDPVLSPAYHARPAIARALTQCCVFGGTWRVGVGKTGRVWGQRKPSDIGRACGPPPLRTLRTDYAAVSASCHTSTTPEAFSWRFCARLARCPRQRAPAGAREARMLKATMHLQMQQSAPHVQCRACGRPGPSCGACRRKMPRRCWRLVQPGAALSCAAKPSTLHPPP